MSSREMARRHGERKVSEDIIAPAVAQRVQELALSLTARCALCAVRFALSNPPDETGSAIEQRNVEYDRADQRADEAEPFVHLVSA